MSTSPVVPTAPTPAPPPPAQWTEPEQYVSAIAGAQLQNQDSDLSGRPFAVCGTAGGSSASERGDVDLHACCKGFVRHRHHRATGGSAPATGASSTSGAAAAMLAANSALTSIPSSPISSSATKSAATTLSTFGVTVNIRTDRCNRRGHPQQDPRSVLNA